MRSGSLLAYAKHPLTLAWWRCWVIGIPHKSWGSDPLSSNKAALLRKCSAGKLLSSSFTIEVQPNLALYRFLQAGIYNGMNNTAGLKGWRWLFIFDGIISLPIAMLGFWLIPDAPSNSRAFYLQEVDKQVAQARMDRHGRARASGMTWSKLVKAFTHWPLWVFAIPYV